MGLDLDLVGRELPSTSLSWTSKDTLLYALAVGAGAADACDELELTTENSVGVEQVVLPGFAFTLAQRAGLTRHLDGVNPAVVLHADQSLDCAQPLPAEGEALATPIVEAIYDKGRSALVRFATTVTAPDGTRYFTSRAGLFLDGLGGWGGERGPAAPTDVPHRPSTPTSDPTRRCSTACAATGTGCIQTPRPHIRPASRDRFCMGCARLASAFGCSCASLRPSTATPFAATHSAR